MNDKAETSRKEARRADWSEVSAAARFLVLILFLIAKISSMNIFYENIDTIDHFTMNLHADSTLTCTHCQKQGNLMSHGFVYEEKQHGKRPVGKRIFCSNRHGKEGCGRTIRLYISDIIPHFQYDTHHLHIFITSLISLFSIKDSYYKATKVKNERNAYRLIQRMWNKLTLYRKHLKHKKTQQHFRTLRFKILIPTLAQLFTIHTIAEFHKFCQTSFL